MSVCLVTTMRPDDTLNDGLHTRHVKEQPLLPTYAV